MSENQFSPKQIASSLNVSESSVKRWCDQGIIPTVRTVGGHRRITVAGLREFLATTNRTLDDPESLGIEPRELELARPKPRRKEIPGAGNDPIQREFRAALAAGDEPRCRELVEDRLGSGWTRAETAEDLIADAMRGLGEAWNCGDLSVYQERRSCNICTQLIYGLRDSLPELPMGAPIAIGGAPETDPYQLPTALVELALREVGWNAINLGNDLPLASMIQAVDDYQPSLVWLSVTSVSDPGRFVKEQNRLADHLDPDVAMILGGRGLDDRLRPKLHYTSFCDSLRHLIDFCTILKRD